MSVNGENQLREWGVFQEKLNQPNPSEKIYGGGNALRVNPV